MSTARTPIGGDAPEDDLAESPEEPAEDVIDLADPDPEPDDADQADAGEAVRSERDPDAGETPDDDDVVKDEPEPEFDDGGGPDGEACEDETLVVELDGEELAAEADASVGDDIAEAEVLGDELDAELEAEAAEMAPLVELPDRPHVGAHEGGPYVGDEVTVRVRGAGRIPARRVRRVIRRVDPLSVLKLSFFFNLCVFAMCLVAAVLLWSAAIGAGSTDNIESFVVDIGFEDFQLVGADLFRGFFVFGGALVIAFTVFAVLLALLFNLISDIVGGIRLTVIEPLLGDPAVGASQGADAD